MIVIISNYTQLLYIIYGCIRLNLEFEMRVKLSLLILAYLLMNVLSAKISESSLIIAKQGLAHKNSKQTCKYLLQLSQRKAVLKLDCPGDSQLNITFNVTIKLMQQTNSYIFELKPYSSQHIKLPIDLQSIQIQTQLKIGIQWTYSITFQTLKNNSYNIVQNFTTNQYKAIQIYLLYLVISLVIFPIGKIYYKNIQGISIFSISLSMQLTIWLGLNLLDILRIYIRQVVQQSTFLHVFSVLGLIICIGFIVFHQKQKLNKLVSVISHFQTSQFNKHLLLICSLSISLLGVIFLYLNQNSILTFLYFISGQTYYMTSFLLYKSMKKHYFSYRLIFFDTTSILTIAQISHYYPINRFWIYSDYQLFAVYLIALFLVIGGGLVYILVNVVRKEIKEKKKQKKKSRIDESVERSIDESVIEVRSQKNESQCSLRPDTPALMNINMYQQKNSSEQLQYYQP